MSVRNDVIKGAEATLRADASGLALHGSLIKGRANDPASLAGTPPLTMPSLKPPQKGWDSDAWVSRITKAGQPDLDLLPTEMLSLT